MAPSSITSSYTNVVGKEPSEANKGREITYGRYKFKDGKVFNRRSGAEISPSQANLSEDEMAYLVESRPYRSQYEPASSGGSDMTSGSRVGGSSVNIKGGGGSGSERSSNPLIRKAQEWQEYYDWVDSQVGAGKFSWSLAKPGSTQGTISAPEFNKAAMDTFKKPYMNLTPAERGRVAGIALKQQEDEASAWAKAYSEEIGRNVSPWQVSLNKKGY